MIITNGFELYRTIIIIGPRIRIKVDRLQWFCQGKTIDKSHFEIVMMNFNQVDQKLSKSFEYEKQRCPNGLYS